MYHRPDKFLFSLITPKNIYFWCVVWEPIASHASRPMPPLPARNRTVRLPVAGIGRARERVNLAGMEHIIVLHNIAITARFRCCCGFRIYGCTLGIHFGNRFAWYLAAFAPHLPVGFQYSRCHYHGDVLC